MPTANGSKSTPSWVRISKMRYWGWRWREQIAKDYATERTSFISPTKGLMTPSLMAPYAECAELFWKTTGMKKLTKRPRAWLMKRSICCKSTPMPGRTCAYLAVCQLRNGWTGVPLKFTPLQKFQNSQISIDCFRKWINTYKWKFSHYYIY